MTGPQDDPGGTHEHLYAAKRPDAGGELQVTPAGSVVVWTDDMLAAADRLRALEVGLAADARRLLAADRERDGLPLGDALVLVERARDDCARGAEALARSAEAYSAAEMLAEHLQSAIGEQVAALAGGALLRLLVTCPNLLLLGAILGWAAIPDGPDGRAGTVRDVLLAHPELVTSPEFVRFVSTAARSIDDGLLGFVGLGTLAAAPGTDPPDGGVALGGISVVALGTMLGMFREGPVRVQEVGTTSGITAPSGARERLDRVPEGDQVRIDSYRAPGMPPRHIVYIGPTETFSPYAEDEPWDMTSNMAGVAGMSPGSLRAVEAAMADAGIRPGDEVQVVGFSQGGLIATLVAASGDWNVVGVETYGAPAGHIPLPDGMAGLAVRNTDDLVPALAGPQLDHSLVQVEREAFAGDAPPPPGVAAPAHQRFSYEATADAIDAAGSEVVRDQIARMDAFASDYLDRPGGTATSTVYHGERVLPSAPAPVPATGGGGV